MNVWMVMDEGKDFESQLRVWSKEKGSIQNGKDVEININNSHHAMKMMTMTNFRGSVFAPADHLLSLLPWPWVHRKSLGFLCRCRYE